MHTHSWKISSGMQIQSDDSGLSRKTNDPWTKAEEKILKKYYPVEAAMFINVWITVAEMPASARQPNYHICNMDSLCIKDLYWMNGSYWQWNRDHKVRQSMTYSEITFKPGKLPELHLRLECDKTGKFRVYEKSVLLDEKNMTGNGLRISRIQWTSDRRKQNYFKQQRKRDRRWYFQTW